MNLQSAYSIGQRVYISLQGLKIEGHVRAIIFTASKVRYSIRSIDSETTLHNVDSAFVCSPPDAEIIDMPEDNYS